jgi:hypothetical protein
MMALFFRAKRRFQITTSALNDGERFRRVLFAIRWFTILWAVV